MGIIDPVYDFEQTSFYRWLKLYSSTTKLKLKEKGKK